LIDCCQWILLCNADHVAIIAGFSIDNVNSDEPVAGSIDAMKVLKTAAKYVDNADVDADHCSLPLSQ